MNRKAKAENRVEKGGNKMRKIKIETWKSNVPKFDTDGTTIIGTEEKEEDLLTALNVLIANKKPEDMPRGIDKTRIYGRIAKAFEKAEESKVLELEESDYTFLKEAVEKDTPASWGMNKNILNAIEIFLEAKSEDSK